MAGLLGGQKTQSEQVPAYTGIQTQTSTYGKVLPIVFGANRLAPNLIWYGAFRSVAVQESSGGKGGVGGSGGKGGGITTYYYYASLIAGICEGPIAGIGKVWVGKTPTSLAASALSLATGALGQAPWSYLVSNFPTQADPYSGVAYAYAANYSLGSTAQLPNHNFEVLGFGHGAFVAGKPDASPAYILNFLITNPIACNLPSSMLGSLTTWTNYCGAIGLWLSPILDKEESVASIINSMMELTNSDVIWSEGQVKVIPYGDENATGNGFTYTAPVTAVYDLTDDDFLSQGDEPPVIVYRDNPADAINVVKMEVCNRTESYVTTIVEYTDQAAVDAFGKRNESTIDGRMFCDPEAARKSVQLRGQRFAIRNKYEFSLDYRFVLLEPMDIVTLTSGLVHLDRQFVRIKSIKGRSDGGFDIQAEEFLNGNASAPTYNFAPGTGYIDDYNVAPGSVNAPIIFEPPLNLYPGESIQVWANISGGIYYGGCEVWASYDNASYELQDIVYGSARQGILTAALPLATGLDTTNTLSVDLSQSRGTLASGSTLDSEIGTTLCIVGNELITYKDATLTGVNQYDVDYLRRGFSGTTPAAHSVGERFARLDVATTKIEVPISRVGNPLYLKFRAFNIYQGAYQELSSIDPYIYEITGSALLAPLPNPTNLSSNFFGGITQIIWDSISADIRTPIEYEIRRGTSWENSQILGRTFNNTFPSYGNGTYWVSARYQAPDGSSVYSATPPSIILTGSTIIDNLIASWDEEATAFSGTLGTNVTRNVSGGDYSLTLDVVSGSVVPEGTYEIPASHQIGLPYVAACSVTTDWSILGSRIDDDVLTVPDILVVADLLGAEFSPFVSARPQIALSQDGTTFGPWAFFSPGEYVFKKMKMRMVLYSYASLITPVLTGWSFAADVPDRFEQFKNVAVPGSAGGLLQAFTNPFQVQPQVQVTVLNAALNDKVPKITVTSTDVRVETFDSAGNPAARNANITVQGY